MSKELQATIRQLAENFAQGVLDAVRSASLEDIRSHASAAPAPVRRGPGRPRRSAVPVEAPPAAKRGRPAKPVSPDVTVDRIVYLVRKAPQGMRSEDLRARLQLDKIPFRQAAAKAMAANLITKTGEKRSTTFFAK
ncbi:MAG TPA: hypothetical protein VNO21_26570 [Polyangiaceae bacterium]|nr:hypothetical protein [Polyangiaceae bacterium]